MQHKAIVVAAGIAVARAQQLPAMNSLVNVSTSSGLYFRFCGGYLSTYVYAQESAADPSGGSFQLQLVPSICGATGIPNAVAFASLTQSANYLAPVNFNGQQRLALQSMQNLQNWPLKYDACFQPVASLDPTKPGQVSFMSLSNNSAYNGKYITMANTNTGSCTNGQGGDIILATAGAAGAVTQSFVVAPIPPLPAPPAATVAIATDAIDHVIEPHFMGCHIDPGFNQQTLTWSPTIIYGNSFDYVNGPSVQAWRDTTSSTATGSATIDQTVHVNPNSNSPSLKLQYQSGSGIVGYSNGGIGYEGLSWQAGQPYEGFAMVLAPSGGTLYVAAHDRNNNTVDDSTTVQLTASAGWQRVNFTLNPVADAGCAGIPHGSDPSIDCGALGFNPGHICVRCAGEFVIGLSQPGDPVWVGFVDFRPGSWATFGRNGVARKETAEAVQAMGVTAIRQGGSVSVGMQWKKWRGPWWTRGAMQGSWNGDLLSLTWGPFEFLDFAASAGIAATLTFDYNLNTAGDWADLIEYLYGNESTTWGAIRTYNDSHPEPYSALRALELGNEQLNPDYVTEIAAVEQRRTAIGAPEIRYLYPAVGWPPTSSMPNDTATGVWQLGGEALARRTCTDLHTGVDPTGGGAVERAYQGSEELPWFPQCFYNCEVNAYFGGFQRAVTEAWDLNQFFNVNASFQQRLQARMASFCTQTSGHFNGFDQALVYSLPNMTYLQPPAHAHAMIASALAQAPNALAVDVSYAGGPASADGWLSVSSQLSDDGTVLVVQLANMNPGGPDGSVTLSLQGSSFTPSGTVVMHSISDKLADAAAGRAPDMNAGNTPAQPDYIVPATTQLYWPQGSSSMTVALPSFSFAVLYVYQ